MKKGIIGGIVGGIIIFLWQFLSWTALDLHRAAQQYTPKQDSILSYLNSQFSEDGSYFLPNCPPGTSHEEMEKTMKAGEGKPWAQVSYHKSMDISMTPSIIRALVVDILIGWLLCWILLQIQPLTLGKVFTVTLVTGIIVFLNAPYTMHIWYKTADVKAHLIDAVASWGLCGIWLGVWLRKREA